MQKAPQRRSRKAPNQKRPFTPADYRDLRRIFRELPNWVRTTDFFPSKSRQLAFVFMKIPMYEEYDMSAFARAFGFTPPALSRKMKEMKAGLKIKEG